LKRSVVVLAGGFSKRFGRDKGLVELAGKPLVLHILDRMFGVVNETLVVVSSDRQKVAFEGSLGQRARVIIDMREEKSPLIGALTGFECVQGEYSLLLPCDTPFVSGNIASLLLDLCINRSAVIPKWPNGYIEPLQAAYHTRSALTAARAALGQGKLDLRSMIACLKGVRYVSTMVLQQLDSKLLTFFNVNNLGDLRRAESMLERL
jgi:molybdopterin-guanine dinucleotide biosynthesis protein A